jgi:hypothetical protein
VLILQVLPAARCSGQLLVSLKLLAVVPDNAMLSISSTVLPVLESVTAWAELDVPAITFANTTADKDTTAEEAGPLTNEPQPEKQSTNVVIVVSAISWADLQNCTSRTPGYQVSQTSAVNSWLDSSDVNSDSPH